MRKARKFFFKRRNSSFLRSLDIDRTCPEYPIDETCRVQSDEIVFFQLEIDLILFGIEVNSKLAN